MSAKSLRQFNVASPRAFSFADHSSQLESVPRGKSIGNAVCRIDGWTEKPIEKDPLVSRGGPNGFNTEVEVQIDLITQIVEGR